MKGLKVAVSSNGVETGVIFNAILETVGFSYEYEEGLFIVAPKGYFDPDVRIEYPKLDGPEFQKEVWLECHDKTLNDTLDDMFKMVDLRYTSPSADIKPLQTSARFEGIPFETALKAILLPQRLTFEQVGQTIVVKYPEKW